VRTLGKGTVGTYAPANRLIRKSDGRGLIGKNHSPAHYGASG